MIVALERARWYIGMRLRGPFPLLMLAGLNAGSTLGSINHPNARIDMEIFRDSATALMAGTSPYALIPNNNAPGSLPFFHAMTAFAPSLWEPTQWFLLSLAAYLVALLILTRIFPSMATPLRLAWALAVYPVWEAVGYGQLYTLLLLAVAVAWWATSRKRLIIIALAAGLLIAFKPNFILWPLLLIVAGHRRQGAAILVGAAFWAALPLLLYGPGVYLDWLAMIRGRVGWELTGAHNSSLQSIAYRAGIAWLGIPLSVAGIAGMTAWGWKARPEPVRAASVGILGSILASPVAMPGYLTLLIPAMLCRPWSRPLRVAAALLLIPLWMDKLIGPGFMFAYSLEISVVYACLALGLLLRVTKSSA